MRQGLFFYLHYALRSLYNSGQRVVLAIVCVTFGVMSLVAMQNLAIAMDKVALVNPAYRLGGDAEINLAEGGNISQANIDQIASLKAAGKIARYNAVSQNYSLILKEPKSNKVIYANYGIGVDPASYPLFGQLTFDSIGSNNLSAAIIKPGTTAITRDIADNLGIKVGDSLQVANDSNLAPFSLRVTAIVTGTPDHNGSQIFYSLDTARQMQGRSDVANYIDLVWPSNTNIPQIKAQLEQSGWHVGLATDLSINAQRATDLFNFMLKGAGILGLIVGGIGVANTMIVLLASRQKEIAILKTLGYRKSHLFFLFGLEVSLMGLAGSLVGVILAFAVSGGLIYLFGQTSEVLMEPSFDPLVALSGIVIGVLTTLIFGAFAIVRASEVRPMQLLRNLPVKIRWFQTALLAVGLAVPFTVITSLIYNSVIEGIEILLVAIGGLLVLGSAFGLVLWLVIKVMPTFRFRFLDMARKNLGRRWLINLFAMIALFTGIFTAAFSGVVIQSAQGQVDERNVNVSGYNLVVYGTPAKEAAIRAALAQQGVKAPQLRYELNPTAIVPEVATPDQNYFSPDTTLDGRETPWDFDITGAAWNSDPLGVYFQDYPDLPLGAKLDITGPNGTKQTVTIVGHYTNKKIGSAVVNNRYGLLMSKDLAIKLGGDKTRLVFASQVEVGQLAAVSGAINHAVPESMVITSVDFNQLATQRVRNLFLFAASMAGLAILAGLILIANTVGLSMIHRKREIGVLKAVGYTRWHVLKSLLYEYALLAAIAGVGALVGVQVMLILIGMLQPSIDGIITLNLPTALASVMLALLVTLATTALASWQALQVRPVTLLRQDT